MEAKECFTSPILSGPFLISIFFISESNSESKSLKFSTNSFKNDWSPQATLVYLI